jgi:hypothetical protein
MSDAPTKVAKRDEAAGCGAPVGVPKQGGQRAPASAMAPAAGSLTLDDCLDLLLLAFRDLADWDDIHQADQRLKLVRRWIRAEAQRAATDPIFADGPAAPRRRTVSPTRRPLTTRTDDERIGWPTP